MVIRIPKATIEPEGMPQPRPNTRTRSIVDLVFVLAQVDLAVELEPAKVLASVLARSMASSTMPLLQTRPPQNRLPYVDQVKLPGPALDVPLVHVTPRYLQDRVAFDDLGFLKIMAITSRPESTISMAMRSQRSWLQSGTVPRNWW